MQIMAFRTSSIHPGKYGATAGFTLVEVLIGASLSSIILAGVLTTFLALGRIGANVQNYSEIEADARKALEIMSREMHLAFVVTSYSADGVTLTIPDSTNSTPNTLPSTITPVNQPPFYNQLTASGSYSVTYSYNSVNKELTRSVTPAANDPYPTVSTLVKNVQQLSGTNVFNYYRYVTPTAATPGQGYVNQYNGNTITG